MKKYLTKAGNFIRANAVGLGVGFVLGMFWFQITGWASGLFG